MGKARLMHIETLSNWGSRRCLKHTIYGLDSCDRPVCSESSSANDGGHFLWIGGNIHHLNHDEITVLHACLGYWLKTGRLPESVESIEEDPQDDEEGARDAENADLDRMVTLMVALIGVPGATSWSLEKIAKDAVALLTSAKRALSQESP